MIVWIFVSKKKKKNTEKTFTFVHLNSIELQQVEVIGQDECYAYE